MRISINTTNRQTIAIIRPRRDLFALLFLGWWIVLWAVGEITLTNIMAGGAQAFLSGHVPNTISTFRTMWPLIAAGLIGWTILGAGMIIGLVWELAGHEELASTPAALTISRRVFLKSASKAFAADQIRELRADASSGWWTSNLEQWGLGGGKIAFEHKGKTVRCGRGITEAEARAIVAGLRPPGDAGKGVEKPHPTSVVA